MLDDYEESVSKQRARYVCSGDIGGDGTHRRVFSLAVAGGVTYESTRVVVGLDL